jgi:hypothetical protein
MPWIASKHLQSGLELSRDVLNMHGQLLLPEGHKLTEEDILFLASWGILEAEVKSLPDHQPFNGGEPDDLRDLREILESRFVRQDFTEPVIRELFDACLSALQREEYSK